MGNGSVGAKREREQKEKKGREGKRGKEGKGWYPEGWFTHPMYKILKNTLSRAVCLVFSCLDQLQQCDCCPSFD